MVARVKRAIKATPDCGDRFLSRNEIREFKNKARLGNAEAAVELLKHSVRCRHRKLAFRRYFLAVELGAAITGKELQYLRQISQSFSADALSEIRTAACRDIPSHFLRPSLESSEVQEAPPELEPDTGNFVGRSPLDMDDLALRVAAREAGAGNVG